MTKYLFIALSFLTFSLSAQNAVPTKTPANTTVGNNKTSTVVPKDTAYLTPIDMVYDTLSIYGIVVDVKTPLGVSTYQVITKNWLYQDGTKKAGEQWLETGGGVKINDWKRRLLWYLSVKDWKD